MLSQERLKQVLSYDPDTGIFFRKTKHRRWKDKPCGSTTKGRVYIQVDKKLYLAHRLAFLYMTGEWPKHQVDHINVQQEDNRWNNLRDVLQRVNLENKIRAKAGTATGLLGVQINNKCNSYMARISAKGKVYYLGSYDTPEKAYAVYVEAKRKLHEGNTL